ncbi:hypothetical protein ACFE04_023939 [Oxalis oulophora]
MVGVGNSNSSSGDNVYWGRKESDCKGIVVLFAWVSINDKQLSDFIDLYSSIGWNSLVSHSHFVNAFYPERAMSLAFFLLDQLLKELQSRPRPVVFVAFSGGSKACLSKVFQIIQGTCEGQLEVDESHLLKSCISGHIYDSGPIDFTSDFCAQFGLHPTLRNMPGSSKLASWFAKGIASGLDGLCLTRFESQRAEYWQALNSSVDLGSPYLILCSENDDLAPSQVISNFVHRLQDHGGDVKFVNCHGSSHLGHYKHYPIQYRAAVSNLLERSALLFSQRTRELGQRVGMDSAHDEISELICDLQNVAVNSNQSLRRVAVGPCDHFFLPSSAQYSNGQESGPLQDEQKERQVVLSSPPSIHAHSVLGQVLFDVCVPKNVEGWDIRFSGCLNGQPLASARKLSPFRSFKGKRRSRL